jgi:hypothetical protein
MPRRKSEESALEGGWRMPGGKSERSALEGGWRMPGGKSERSAPGGRLAHALGEIGVIRPRRTPLGDS